MHEMDGDTRTDLDAARARIAVALGQAHEGMKDLLSLYERIERDQEGA